jgi:large subunit ribosomal protein L29
MKSRDLNQKFRDMSLEELAAQERDYREDLFKLRFQNGVRQVENTARIRILRKDIARLKTVVSAKKQ